MKAVINVYQCRNGHQSITEDVADGVTPMIIGCLAEGCRESATSRWYMVDQTLKATHEWYLPVSFRHVSRAEREHVRQGGLLLRKKV